MASASPPAEKKAAGPKPAARRRLTALTDDVDVNIGAWDGFVSPVESGSCRCACGPAMRVKPQRATSPSPLISAEAGTQAFFVPAQIQTTKSTKATKRPKAGQARQREPRQGAFVLFVSFVVQKTWVPASAGMSGLCGVAASRALCAGAGFTVEPDWP